MFEDVMKFKSIRKARKAEQVAMVKCAERRQQHLDCSYDNCHTCPAFCGECDHCFAFELAERAHPIRGFIERHFRNNPKAHKKGGK